MGEVLTDFTPAVLARAIEANMVEYFARLAAPPHGEVLDTPELVRIYSHVPFPGYNAVQRTRFPHDLPPSQVRARIQFTRDYFAARQQPFFWFSGPETTPPSLGQHLAVCGLTHHGEELGMAVDLSALPATVPTPPGLNIVPVYDDDALRVWVALGGVGLGATEAVHGKRFAAERALGLGPGSPVQHYLAYLDGQPVAKSAFYLGAGVVGIYAVVTIPQSRRQGIGTAVTLQPLHDARALGYHVGVLQSSAMGFGVYTRLGFWKVCAFSLHGWQPQG